MSILKSKNQILTFLLVTAIIIAYLAIMIFSAIHEKRTHKDISVEFRCLNNSVSPGGEAVFYYKIKHRDDSVFIVSEPNTKKMHYLEKDSGTYAIEYSKVDDYHVYIKTKDRILDSTCIIVITEPYQGGVSGPSVGYMPLPLDSNIINDSAFYIPPSLLDSLGVLNQKYWTDFKVFKNYGISAHNFLFTTTVKNNSSRSIGGCNDIVIDLKGEWGFIRVYFVKNKCDEFVILNFGENTIKSNNHDVSMFCTSISEYRTVSLENKNKHVNVFLDNKKIFSNTFQKDIGKLIGINYSFKGSGYIKNIALKDTAENIIFKEKFY